MFKSGQMVRMVDTSGYFRTTEAAQHGYLWIALPERADVSVYMRFKSVATGAEKHFFTDGFEVVRGVE